MAAQVYYRIGQAAALLGVSTSALRNWERLGLVKPARTGARYRLYSRETFRELKRISYLRSAKRVNLAGIRHLIQSRDASETLGGPGESGDHANALGERLARLRHDQKLTLGQVASATQLSPSFISGIERGRATPSIATLQKLASFYRTNVLSFFGVERQPKRLVRPKDRRVLRPELGVQMELLAFGDYQMEPHLFRIAPKGTSGGSYKHEGEEFLYLLQGKLEIWLDEIERYVLEPGDSLYFRSAQAHRWRSLSDRDTVLLWINTPPTF
jgi:DNA-binding transcriptional MerR regulator/quercetin dioxygenase-like cupin family protein